MHELELHRPHQNINIPSWPKLSAIVSSSSFMSEIREHFDLQRFSVQCINKFIFHLTISHLLNLSSFVSVRKARTLLKYISLSELVRAKTTYIDQENKLQVYFVTSVNNCQPIGERNSMRNDSSLLLTCLGWKMLSATHKFTVLYINHKCWAMTTVPEYRSAPSALTLDFSNMFHFSHHWYF